jgi:hypothetical protein
MHFANASMQLWRSSARTAVVVICSCGNAVVSENAAHSDTLQESANVVTYYKYTYDIYKYY